MKQWVENAEKEHRIEMLHNMDVALLFMHRITPGIRKRKVTYL